MAYTKTNWVNGSTPINDTNLNHMEDGIYNNDQSISGLNSSKQDVLVGSGTGQNIKTINNLPLPGTGNINVAGTPLTAHSNSDDNVYSCNYINNISDYFLTEQIVGVWTDGTPVYETVLDIPSLPSEYTQYITNVRGIIRYEGWTERSANEKYFARDSVAIYIDRARLMIKAKESYHNSTHAYLIVRYLKTTDTPSA